MALLLGVACGAEGPPPPIYPDEAQKAETAAKVDEAGGHPQGPIGVERWRFTNIGMPKGTSFLPTGEQLTIYQKATEAVKLGDVEFNDVRLFFDRHERLAMFEAVRRGATEDECRSAGVALTLAYGLGEPITPTYYRWAGTKVVCELRYEVHPDGGRCTGVWSR